MQSLTIDRLKCVLRYDEMSGHFFWLVHKSPRSKIGDKAGQYESGGYIRIKIDGVDYLAHRLAWLYTHGSWPESEIDHANRVRDDNRISNLREATPTQNKQNIGMKKNNKSGFIGVSWDKNNNKWKAKIVVNYKAIQIGLFDDPEIASAAYLEAKKKYHEFWQL